MSTDNRGYGLADAEELIDEEVWNFLPKRVKVP